MPRSRALMASAYEEYTNVHKPRRINLSTMQETVYQRSCSMLARVRLGCSIRLGRSSPRIMLSGLLQVPNAPSQQQQQRKGAVVTYVRGQE